MLQNISRMIKRSFIYGIAVGGNNFTDRIKETARLKQDFENGQNVVLISPRRMGKTSLVKHVQEVVNKETVTVVYMDIYDCKTEYEFYNKFATAILKQTSGKMDTMLQHIKEFLIRLSPKIAFSPDPNSEMSVSLGITPKEYSAEEILQLPEKVARKTGRHIMICIDEFQQIGELKDSLSVQKRLRGVWQLQQNVSYCLFGSKKHMLSNLFQNKKMPFYQFGDLVFLQPIPTVDWIPFIKEKFEARQMKISDAQIVEICDIVDNQSSYVQQLAWNVMLNTETEVSDESITAAVADMLNQNSSLFLQQIDGLSVYQMNFLRAVAQGVHDDFTSQKVLNEHQLGTKSNISRIISALIKKEIIEKNAKGIEMADPVFRLWFTKEWCQ